MYKGVQLKSKLQHELHVPQHGRPTACVIARQYSARISKLLFQLFFNFFKLRKSENA
jgi:hypothetical protein